MRRYLVVAHRTMGGPHLLEELQRRRAEDPYCTFHLIVPVHHPARGTWSDHDVQVAAKRVLAEMLERLAEMRIGATGEVGDANPVYAVGSALRRHGEDGFDGIIVSTLPKGSSRWWMLDVPRRIATQYSHVPVTHVVAEEAFAT